MKRTFIFVVIVGLLITILSMIFVTGIGRKDLVAYWSASHLLLQGNNPYNPEVLLSLHTTNLQQAGIPNAWNPPWLLILFFPLAFLPFDIAGFLWMWVSIILVGLSAHLCLKLAGVTRTGRLFIWVFVTCILFPPVLFLLSIGQISLLVLVGILAGVYAIKRGYYFLAGALFVLATVKPHLSYLVLAWIGWWIIRNRKWPVVLGFIIPVGVSTGIALMFYPSYFQAYVDLLKNMDFNYLYTSTVWNFLEVLTGTTISSWYGFFLLPFVFLLQPSQDQVDWLPKLNLILVTSIAFAPYGFTFDQVMLLPIIVQIILWARQKKLVSWKLGVVTSAMLITYLAAILQMNLGNLPYYVFFWIPFALLLIYLFALWVTSRSESAGSGSPSSQST